MASLNNKIVIRTADIRDEPLAVVPNASAVEIYEDGKLTAVLTKVLDNTHWACTTKQDPDWKQALQQLGYLTR